jgi:hypothetical protein
MLWRFDALRRFLLERMQHPNFIADLHGIHETECITPQLQRDLKDSGAKAFERFGNIGIAALGGNGERSGKLTVPPLGSSGNLCLQL